MGSSVPHDWVGVTQQHSASNWAARRVHEAFPPHSAIQLELCYSTEAGFPEGDTEAARSCQASEV